MGLMGSMADLNVLFASVVEAQSIPENEEAAPDLFVKQGDALVALAQRAMQEAARVFEQGVSRHPTNMDLQKRLRHANGRAEKMEVLFSAMDSGLQRCMGLINELQSSKRSRVIVPAQATIRPPPLETMLITANTGSPFEEPALEQPFLELLHVEVSSRSPHFVQIHFQEFCGKHWTERDLVATAEEFTAKLSTGLPHYTTTGLMFYVAESASDKQFTALAMIGFVRNDIANSDRARLWDFDREEAVRVCDIDRNDPSLRTRFTRWGNFPKNEFPELKAGRKGFLQTRWVLDGRTVDMVNIHMFHDDSNLVAYEHGFPSLYAQCRAKALASVAERTQLETASDCFVYGDFNFRLDLQSVTRELMADQNIQPERGEGTLTFSNGSESLLLAKKKFQSSQLDEFQAEWPKFRQFDLESGLLFDKHELAEFPIEFPPSYPYEEDVGVPRKLMPTRCPGWCDRVVFKQGMEARLQDPHYGLLGLHASVGDHKPVYLTFAL